MDHHTEVGGGNTQIHVCIAGPDFRVLACVRTAQPAMHAARCDLGAARPHLHRIPTCHNATPNHPPSRHARYTSRMYCSSRSPRLCRRRLPHAAARSGSRHSIAAASVPAPNSLPISPNTSRSTALSRSPGLASSSALAAPPGWVDSKDFNYGRCREGGGWVGGRGNGGSRMGMQQAGDLGGYRVGGEGGGWVPGRAMSLHMPL